MSDPYKVLGLNPGASKDEIKKAYRKLALENHPDHGGNEDRFKQINEAYSILTGKSKPKQQGWDRPPQHQNINLDDLFGKYSPFSDMFGRRPPRPEPQKPKQKIRDLTDDEINFNFKISLAELKKGSKKRIRFKRKKSCIHCKGEGGFNKIVCGTCNGMGVLQHRPHPMVIQQVPCTVCKGMGKTMERYCGPCSGTGTFDAQESILVEISEIKDDG
tara:strand:- start:277 stop:924 length:648 start_codon:yes stop_codon:yes gene_type:complete